MLKLAWFFTVLAAIICLGLHETVTNARGLSRSHGGTYAPPTFSNVSFGTFATYGNGACPAAKCITGDSYYNTWADDDNIYTTTADTYDGWNGALTGSGGRNLFTSSLSGYSPTLTGTMVNSMDLWGTITQIGSDNAHYKTAGMISVNGTLIMTTMRQQNTPTVNWFSATLIKSTNHGTTWTPQPPSTAAPYATPTFTDPKFRVPSFIQYGKNYVGQTADRSDQYVYALSPDLSGGHYSTATGASDQVFLGRVPVSVIANLSAADWQYYQGGDGMLDASWGSTTTAAVPVMSTPGTNSFQFSGLIQYLPLYQQYLYIVGIGDPTTTTTWNIWRGAHPWSWSQIQSVQWGPGNPQAGASGFYLQSAISKSVQVDGGHTLTLLTTGNYNAPAHAQYTMYIVPATLN